MKNYCVPFILCLVVLSCNMARTADVPKGTAAAVVKGWLAGGGTRLGKQLGTRPGAVMPIKSHDTGDVLYFVVLLDPEGFVVVAPNDEVEPIIAFTDKGTFVNNPNSPLVAVLERDLAGRLRTVRSDARTGMKQKNRQLWGRYLDLARGKSVDRSATISDVRVGPLLSSEWSQDTAGGYNCYNYYTPYNYYCGCVATACAQIMRYYQHPATGIGVVANTISVGVDASSTTDQTATTRGGDGAGGAYNWSIMTLKPESATYSEASWQMIGALCYDIGVAVGMQYTKSSSSSSPTYATIAMTQVFKYANAVYMSTSEQTIYSAINSNLKGHLPVFVSLLTASGAGHAVVCDGFGFVGGTVYHHINLGWGGYADAWYNLPNVETGWYDFTVVDKCIFNIFPGVTGEMICGRITDGEGNPVSGATITAQSQSDGSTYTATSGSNGYYGVCGIPSDTTCNLSAAKTGYATGTLAGIPVATSGQTACGNYANADITLAASGPSIDAPAGVSASDGTYSNVVSVSWEAVSGATGYEVWRGSFDSSTYAARIASGVGTNIYTDSEASEGSVYFYWVKTESNTTTSAFSASDSGYCGDMDLTAVYRLYSYGSSDSTYEHLWTTSATERDTLDSWPSWEYEGIAWYAYAGQVSGSVPLYRLYASSVKQHHYTINAVEYATLDGNGTWAGEGTQYYVYQTNSLSGLMPAYRFYHAGLALHHFTISANEMTDIVNNPAWGYEYEGIGFYVFATNETSSGLNVPPLPRLPGTGQVSGLEDENSSPVDPALWENRCVAGCAPADAGCGMLDLAVRAFGKGLFEDKRLVSVPGDYDGDAIEDAAFYDLLEGKWYIWSSAGEVILDGEQWGGEGFVPVEGDYADLDATPVADLAVYHRDSGTWFIRSVDGVLILWNETWGGPDFDAVPMDCDGDGLSDLAVRDEDSGVWYIRTVDGTIMVP